MSRQKSLKVGVEAMGADHTPSGVDCNTFLCNHSTHIRAMTIKDWRKQNLRAKNVQPAVLSAKLGKRTSYFYDLMNDPDKAFGEKSARDIEAGMGWESGELDREPGLDVVNTRATQKQDVTRIHQFDTGGAMGHGLVLRDQPGVIRSWNVSPEWLHQNVHRVTSVNNLRIVTGFGDSMRPIFNPGDPLIIDTGRTRADVDGIYFFRVGEEGFIKRLQRIPTADGMILRAKSENPRYDPFDIGPGMDFEVFGWVVKAWRGEDF